MRFVADTSALIHAWRAGDNQRRALAQRVQDGQLAIIEPVRLEVLRGAASPSDAQRLLAWFGGPNRFAVGGDDWTQAERTVIRLARLKGGQHRGLAVTDLLVAAVAYGAGLPVLHRDRDFDLIASVTGQPVRWFGAPA